MKKITILILFNTLYFSVLAQTNQFKVKVGDPAPDFSLKLTDGKIFKLSENKGKVIVLQFTASWCGVCTKEMPHIENKIWLPHKSKGIIVLAIDREEPEYTVKNYQKRAPVTYPFAMDLDATIFNKYAEAGTGVTRNVVIDKNGRIAYLTRLYNEPEFAKMVNKINQLMK
jgi:peroxiredoxin